MPTRKRSSFGADEIAFLVLALQCGGVADGFVDKVEGGFAQIYVGFGDVWSRLDHMFEIVLTAVKARHGHKARRPSAIVAKVQ